MIYYLLFIEDESYHRPLSPIQSQISILNNSQPVYGSKSKRTLSYLDEINQQIHEPKRTKSFDEDDDDDDDLSQLIDHRRTKKILSQNSNTTISSQITIDDKQRKPTVRKPTARKLSASQQKPIAYVYLFFFQINISYIIYFLLNRSQPIPTEQFVESHEILVIEPDVDTEEENTIDREGISWLSKRSQISNIESEGINLV